MVALDSNPEEPVPWVLLCWSRGPCVCHQQGCGSEVSRTPCGGADADSRQPEPLVGLIPGPAVLLGAAWSSPRSFPRALGGGRCWLPGMGRILRMKV